jgi:alkanesulfonate monooxygenase SsuD/methylene tetrahydromethanopterin reductase-like flavin-dependent oxidoreductase (luciferase family)
VKFSLIHQTSLPAGKSDVQVLQDTVEQIVAAERLGYEAFWLTEHHFSPYGMACLEPILGYAAARTQRIRLGASVWVTPLHHPVRLAENVAALDILTGGRLNFGVGRGYAEQEFAGYGVSIQENRSIHEETLDIVLRAWSDEPVAYEGRYWQIAPVDVRPKPLQRPHPPIYQPLISPPSMAEAIAAGRNAVFGPRFQPMEVVLNMTRPWKAALAAAGKQLEALITLPVYVAESDAEARRDLAEPLMWLKQQWIEQQPPGRMSAIGAMTFEQTYPTCLAGEPEAIIARLRWLAEHADAKHVLCSMHFGSLPQARVLRSMELFSRHVMPAFQAALV